MMAKVRRRAASSRTVRSRVETGCPVADLGDGLAISAQPVLVLWPSGSSVAKGSVGTAGIG
jgi:hypothetical protein